MVRYIEFHGPVDAFDDREDRADLFDPGDEYTDEELAADEAQRAGFSALKRPSALALPVTSGLSSASVLEALLRYRARIELSTRYVIDPLRLRDVSLDRESSGAVSAARGR